MKLLVVLFAVALMDAQSDPRPKPGDYPAHTELAEFTIGAEYMGRQFFSGDKAQDSGDFIAVEVGLYPRPGVKVAVTVSRFALRFNGKRDLLYAQPAGVVAAAMRLKPWDEQQRRVVVVGGVGDTELMVGPPVPTERFPGDRQGQRRLPNPPRAPDPDYKGNVETAPVEPIADLLAKESLQEATTEKPVRGYLFFNYTGKLAKLNKIELVVVDEKSPGALTIKKPR